MSRIAAEREKDVRLSGVSHYFVLDDEDRVVSVGPRRDYADNPFLGHVLWSRLPEAEPLLRPRFDEARRTRQEIEFTTFYAGRTKHITVIPAADGIAVHVEQLTALDVRSLATLAKSLEQIEAELDARAHERLDPPALGSLQPLP
ncbi:hypothetical protein BH09ACT13_BH09ACT13_07020 [soil metagenome]